MHNGNLVLQARSDYAKLHILGLRNAGEWAKSNYTVVTTASAVNWKVQHKYPLQFEHDSMTGGNPSIMIHSYL